jgi:hypothetical protein
LKDTAARCCIPGSCEGQYVFNYSLTNPLQIRYKFGTKTSSPQESLSLTIKFK